jgi:hypothetical protein
MIVTIPPKLLANLRAQQQAAMNQMSETVQVFLMTLDIPDGTQGRLYLDRGVIEFPEEDTIAKS